LDIEIERRVIEMSMYEVASEIKSSYKDEIKELTGRQIWLMVRLAKMVRRYCRSNVAFNNAMNTVFKDVAVFKVVAKLKKDGTTYDGLSIDVKGVSVTDVNTEMED
jgi:hypothetical protein